MFLAHQGKSPVIDPTAWVAPDATLCGDVTLGAGARVMHGARLIAEGGGTLRIGRNCIVLENAVIRATARQNCSIGDHSLVGPGAHVVGAEVGTQVFIATGASVFHGAVLGDGAEVRINAIVHLKTRLAPGATVPIGWVAVGDPARILPPHEHDAIWALQKPLNFPEFVYGADREAAGTMLQITAYMSEVLGEHRNDREVSGKAK